MAADARARPCLTALALTSTDALSLPAARKLRVDAVTMRSAARIGFRALLAQLREERAPTATPRTGNGPAVDALERAAADLGWWALCVGEPHPRRDGHPASAPTPPP